VETDELQGGKDQLRHARVGEHPEVRGEDRGEVLRSPALHSTSGRGDAEQLCVGVPAAGLKAEGKEAPVQPSPAAQHALARAPSPPQRCAGWSLCPSASCPAPWGYGVGAETWTLLLSQRSCFSTLSQLSKHSLPSLAYPTVWARGRRYPKSLLTSPWAAGGWEQRLAAEAPHLPRQCQHHLWSTGQSPVPLAMGHLSLSRSRSPQQ